MAVTGEPPRQSPPPPSAGAATHRGTPDSAHWQWSCRSPGRDGFTKGARGADRPGAVCSAPGRLREALWPPRAPGVREGGASGRGGAGAGEA